MTTNTDTATDTALQSIVDALYQACNTARRAHLHDLFPDLVDALYDTATLTHLALADRLDTRWYGD
jgi:signal transduction histidine kinase